jgi:hypothetical protein
MQHVTYQAAKTNNVLFASLDFGHHSGAQKIRVKTLWPIKLNFSVISTQKHLTNTLIVLNSRIILSISNSQKIAQKPEIK